MDEHCLGPNINLYSPRLQPSPSAPPPPGPPAPTLIVLCTWQGAAPRSRGAARYVAGYHALFPAASILLLRTELADMTYRTQRTIRRRLAPARAVLARHLAATTTTRPPPTAAPKATSTGAGAGVLLHIFSHGGLATALHLLAALPPPNPHHPHDHDLAYHAPHLVVADSCPGAGTFRETYHAGLASLTSSPSPSPSSSAATSSPPSPPPLHHRAALAVAVAALYTLHAAGAICSVPGLRRAMHADLGRTTTTTTTNTPPPPRLLYFASDGDAVIPAAHVVAHARAAAAAGRKVRVVRFARARHCALVLEDPARYWGAVRASWAAAAAERCRGGEEEGQDEEGKEETTSLLLASPPPLAKL